MSGHGFKLSPAVGEMIAARIVGATPPVSATPFAFDRFATIAPGATFVSSYLKGNPGRVPPAPLVFEGNPGRVPPAPPVT